MELASEILSNVTIFTKYAKYLPSEKRRENWGELVTRNKNMHLQKFPQLKDEIEAAYKFVYDKKILPSMRALQFGGKPIEINNTRLYNCCFVPMNDPVAFNELMFLLLSGTGVGYSVQRHHIEQLPEIKRPTKTKRYLVADSIEGWADAVKMLMKSYFSGRPSPIFDFRDIRPKGAALVTSGGKAPGSEPLKDGLHNIQKVLDRKQTGDKLTSLEVHDICCYIADSVLAGGIRRSAMISLFDLDDEDMLTCKFGNWYETDPHRARSNNSATILRHDIDKETFLELWKKIELSGSGEPGFFFTNDKEFGLNPCKPLKSLILTESGYITFEQALQMESLRVVRPDGTIVDATKPFKTGQNRSVSRIMLSNGMSLYGTENHKHQLENGVWKRVDELQLGDRLSFAAPAIHTLDVINTTEYNAGILNGWVVADGWNYKRTDSHGNRAGIVLGNNEFDLVPLFESLTNKIAKPHPSCPHTAKLLYVEQKLLDPNFSKKSFDWVRLKSSSYKLGFLRSVFTADGSVRKHNNCELYSINKEFLEVAQTLLLEFGVRSSITIHNYAKSYVAKDDKIRNNANCWKLNVYAGQFKRIGFLSASKSNLLKLQDDCGLFCRINYETVVNIIEHDSIEDVYDITVNDESHSFYDTGVVTHNCAEISLRANQFCNLVTINSGTLNSQEEYNARAKAAAFIATLQASYTDFHYLRDVWKKVTEKEALIGVSMTGIASGSVIELNMKEAADIVKEENARVAALIGINKAARTTTVKPEGSASLVLGTSSGIHAWHNDYYIRRLRLGKNESIYHYLSLNHPELIEDEFFKPTQQSVLSVPQKAPEGAITRQESALDLLKRVSLVWQQWVKPGHRKGANKNNVSTTVTVKPDEWEEVGNWMWSNRDNFTALSVLPYSDHGYVQAPFEDITKKEYDKMMKNMHAINLDEVVELTDDTNLVGEVACGGGTTSTTGGCEAV